MATRASAQAPATAPAPADDAKEIAAPTYFRSISAISPGSLALTYQAIRAQETGAVVPATPSGQPAILSAQGLPGAFDAYRETGGWE